MRSAINGQVAPSLSSHNYYIDDYDYSDNYFVGIGNSCGLGTNKGECKGDHIFLCCNNSR